MVIVLACQVPVLICFLQLLSLEFLQICYTFNSYVVSPLTSTPPCITLHAGHILWIYMKQTVATCRILKGNCWNVLWIPKTLWTNLQIAVNFWKLLLTAGKWRKKKQIPGCWTKSWKLPSVEIWHHLLQVLGQALYYREKLSAPCPTPNLED
jgi:hypothetical protein